MYQEQDNHSFPNRPDAGSGFQDNGNHPTNQTYQNGTGSYPNGGFPDNYRPDGFRGYHSAPGPLPPSSPKSGTGKKIGLSILLGGIAGITASAVFLCSVGFAMPSMTEHASGRFKKAIEQAAEKEIKKLHASLPEKAEENTEKKKDSDSRSAAPDTSADSTSDSAEAAAEKKGGYLGISCQEIKDQEDHENMPSGVYIADVQQGSPASIAGLKPNDIITAIDGKKVSSFRDLKEILTSREPGTKTTLTIARKSGKEYKESTHDAILAEWPQEQEQMPDSSFSPFGQSDTP